MRALFSFLVLTGLALGAPNGFDQALNLYQHTDYRGAIATLKQLPEDVHALELLGQCYFMEAEFRKATDILEKAASLDPKSSSIQTWLGRAYGRRAETSFAIPAIGYATRARQALERAVQLDGRNMEAVNDLFEYYIEAPSFMGGGYDKAQGLISLIAKNDLVEAHYAQARLAESKKEYSAAEAQLRRAAELAPQQVGRALDLAKFLANHGRYDESEKTFQEAAKIAPDSPKVLFARADTYIKTQRNLDQARDLLEKYLAATNLTPDDPPRSEALKLLKKAQGG